MQVGTSITLLSAVKCLELFELFHISQFFIILWKVGFRITSPY